MIRKNIHLFLCVLSMFMMSRAAMAQGIVSEAWRAFLQDDSPVRSNVALGKDSFYLINMADLKEPGLSATKGLTIIRKLDASTAIIRLTAESATSLLGLGEALWQVNDEWKLSQNLNVASLSSEPEDYLIKSTDLSQLSLRLEALGIVYKQLGPELVRISALGTLLATDLLLRPDVYYIGKESMDVTLESRVIDMNLNPNAVNRIHHSYPELDGSGRVLSIREGMFDTSDMDLRARYLASSLEGDVPTNHATEMATIAAGAGNSSLNGRGVAAGVQLTGSLLEELVPDADADYLSLNAWVQNHSYGTSEVENFYGAFAEAYDRSANTNPNLLHVFSAGNLGTATPETGTYQGSLPVANMTGNFKMSKNTLAVSSVDTVGREVNFVSRGPAHDGRIKPELVTYSMAGTSNSAALVSGVSILLQQAHQQIHNTLPPSALLKALLINSAEDVGTTGPDYVMGYGNVNAFRSLENLRAGRFLTGMVADGENQRFTLDIPANAINLKVTLVWNDPAATANANVALVNDLDLKLITSDSQELLPWVLNPALQQLSQPAVRGVDHLNNVEQVTLANPATGPTIIEVSAFDIPEGSQGFYVTWQWDEVNTFDWSFPTGSDNMPYNGETVSYFRWESTLAEATGTLEYSVDNGMTWQTIATDINLSDEQYRWDAPQLRSAAIARMVVDGSMYLTDVFTISRPERIRVGFSCSDSVRLQWNDLPEAAAYEVYTFGGASLESIGTVTDTSYTFNKSAFDTRLFAVRPVLAGGAQHVRAATIDYNFQGVGCYLVSFFAQSEDEAGVRVNVGLGTIAGVSEIVIERQVRNEGFEEITSISGDALASGTDFLDRSPDQGLNEYRASVRFDNGEQLATEISSVYFLTTEPFLVFPNPVSRGDRLNVFSKVFTDNPEVVFSLYDQAGLPVFTLDLLSERVSFGLDRLQAGIYFYRITTDGYSHKGRIILE